MSVNMGYTSVHERWCNPSDRSRRIGCAHAVDPPFVDEVHPRTRIRYSRPDHHFPRSQWLRRAGNLCCTSDRMRTPCVATTDSAVSPLKWTSALPHFTVFDRAHRDLPLFLSPCYAPVTAPSFFFLGFRFLPSTSPPSNSWLPPFRSPTRVLSEQWPNTAPSTPRYDPLAQLAALEFLSHL